MGNRHVSAMIGAPPETVFGLYTDPGRATGRRASGTSAWPVRPTGRAAGRSLSTGGRSR
jgi:hypothetical protein